MTVRRTLRGGDFGSLNTPSLVKTGWGIGVVNDGGDGVVEESKGVPEEVDHVKLSSCK